MTIILDRRTLLGGFAIGAAGLGVAPAAARARDAKGCSFAVLGDWGRDTPEQHHVAAAMGRAAAEAGSDFVLAIGDNFYSDGVASVDDPLWQSVFEGVYTHPALQVPWYALLGNHDYRGNPQAQIDYAARSKRWRMPARYYRVADPALARADTELFAIDTSPLVERYRADATKAIGRNTLSQDTAQQLAWLDEALAQSRARWKLVTGHHPIRSGGSGHGDQPEIVARVLPILNRHGVQAYIAGHDHDLQHIRRDGIDMIQCGGGMEARPVVPVEGTRFCRAAAGFGMVRIAGDLLSFDLRDERGASLYNASVPVRALA
ncbi:metallophosphoesterase [Sphingomonas sp. 2R-10]|uniref:metallophosphoesterase n=1 Tax=Sphingomonas sp. 2R-10 TaxID=3045148 RepID=UPI0013DD8D29|nr:metallophosphoesterase [Sphingomonas sp. 2R-10]MDJ0277181.1 metallophosphoesterase [Sphingomonas sp. 2R-10]